LWLVIIFGIALVGWPKREPPAEIDFWDYRWIAVILLALSFFALVVSFVVKDDRSIDKGSWVFWAGLIGQFLALIWYMTYVWLTFKHQRSRPTESDAR
jgi:cytochrome bd-type quinol oxidase subunit 1